MTIAPKKTHGRGSTPRRKQRLTSAAESASSPKHIDLTYYQKLKLVEYWAASRRLTRAGAALYFRSQFPHITLAIISQYLADKAALRRCISICPNHPGHLCLTPDTLPPHTQTHLPGPYPHIRDDERDAVASSTGSPTSFEEPTRISQVSNCRATTSVPVTHVENETQHRVVDSNRPTETELSSSE